MNVQKSDEYAEIIIRDETEKIVSETPTVYTDERVERVYEFADGAVVKYEWQSLPRDDAPDRFNHKFTLVTLPSPNPRKFKTGVVKTINY